MRKIDLKELHRVCAIKIKKDKIYKKLIHYKIDIK